MAHDVFIGYATEDRAIADAVCATLERKGIRCWYVPRDVVGDWAKAIMNAIEASRVMVLVLSGHADASRVVLDEVVTALKMGLTVIPLRIVDGVPTGSMALHLANIHWLDALTPPIEMHLSLLADKVQSCLGVVTPPAPSPPPLPPSRAWRLLKPRWHRNRPVVWVALLVGALTIAFLFLLLVWKAWQFQGTVGSAGPRRSEHRTSTDLTATDTKLASEILAAYKVDVYFERDSEYDKEMAKNIAAILEKSKIVRKVVLVPRPTGFLPAVEAPAGYEVRYGPEEELPAARALAATLNNTGMQLEFVPRRVATPTRGTLSIFLFSRSISLPGYKAPVVK